MVLLEEVNPAEVLLLVGNCNDWNPNSAARSHVLVQKRGPIPNEVQHEVWLRVGVSNEVEFQIISKKHKWDWRLFPRGDNKTLVCAKPKALDVGLARGHGAKDAHNRNFLVQEAKGSMIVVKVRLGHKLKVWYDRPVVEDEPAPEPALPAAGSEAPEAEPVPGPAPAAAEAFGRRERLRLVGPFCSWRLEAAGLVFQRRFSAQNAAWQEHRLYLQLHADPIEFQIVSDQLGFKWRLFPKYEDKCALPKTNDPAALGPEVVVGGENDGHHLNFIIDDEPLGVVAISVWLQVMRPLGEEGASIETLMRSREHIRARVTYEPVGCSLQEAMQIVLGCAASAGGSGSGAGAEPRVLREDYASSSDPNDPMELLGKEEACSPEFWKGVCPWLHVEDKAWQDKALQGAAYAARAKAPAAGKLGRQLEAEGYFTIAKEDMQWSVDVAKVARGAGLQAAPGVTEIVKMGLPAACILLFDEPWVMAAQLRPIVSAATGGNEPIFDWAAFCVQAGSKSGHAPAGWPPHRDRMSDRSAAHGFRADGSPKYVTCWMALTDATLESSCLMVVPKSHDPGYAEGDARNSPLDTVFCRPERFQHIRPLPTAAGGVVAFSHRLLHWGTAATPEAPAPRVAIAFGAAAPDYERPYLPRSLLPLPSFGLRLSLMAGQVITYSDNEQVITTTQRLRILYQLFMENASEFSADYRQTVTRFNSFKHEQLHGSGIPTAGR